MQTFLYISNSIGNVHHHIWKNKYSLEYNFKTFCGFHCNGINITEINIVCNNEVTNYKFNPPQNSFTLTDIEHIFLHEIINLDIFIKCEPDTTFKIFTYYNEKPVKIIEEKPGILMIIWNWIKNLWKSLFS
jgi:hypothetical protein